MTREVGRLFIYLVEVAPEETPGSFFEKYFMDQREDRQRQAFIKGVRKIIIDEYRERRQNDPNDLWVDIRLQKILKALKLA